MSAKSVDLSGKIAVITGAGSGFGQAMSVAFCKAGAQVFGLGRRAAKLEETAALAGENFIPAACDISNPVDVKNVVKTIAIEKDALHILINNAAVLLDEGQTISSLDWDNWESTWRVNVSGTLAMSQACLRIMKKQRYGRIANVTSGLGFDPMLEYGSYCVSKAAVNMLTRVLALEGAPSGVLVNAIEPGVGRTEMNTWATDPAESVNAVALYLASLPNDGPTGRCFNKKLQEVSW